MYSKAEEICRSSDIYDVTSSTNGKIGARVENDESDNDVRKIVSFETHRWEGSRTRHRGHCDELVGHPAELKAPASFRPIEGTVLVHPLPRA